MKPVIYLICGVPGSGKTWVCEQLRHQFAYVPHDDFIDGGLVDALIDASGPLPVITECPFGERKLKDELERAGFDVRPHFIVEPVEVVQRRYEEREGRPLPKASVTRAGSIVTRADEWKAPRGTSAEVLAMLGKEAA